MTDFQVSTIDGPAAGWHYNTLVEPDRVIWLVDSGAPLGWTRVGGDCPGAIAYTRAAYLPAGVELDRGVIAYVRAEQLDSGCSSTHGGSGWAHGSYRDGDVVVCGTCGARVPCANLPVPEWVENGTTRYAGAKRLILSNETTAMTRDEVLDAAQSAVRGMTPTEIIVDELRAADVTWPTATGGKATIVSAVVYDSNHRCPWWSRLPLIGRRHRCPIWTVDLEAKR